MELDFTCVRAFCAENGIVPAPDFEEKTSAFLALLAETNKTMNLTAITEPGEMMQKHVLDSLTALAACGFPQGASVCDVGCGAGFPGVILKLARPDLSVSLLDATQKKLAFIEAGCGRLGARGVSFLHMRAEEAGRQPKLRERFDIVTARAVAALPALLEYCLPLTRVGGQFLAMKGASAREELAAAKNAIGTLGGALRRSADFTLPDGGARTVFVVAKERETPAAYPRAQAKITKKPL